MQLKAVLADKDRLQEEIRQHKDMLDGDLHKIKNTEVRMTQAVQ